MQKNYLKCPIEWTEDVFGESSTLKDVIEGLAVDGVKPRVLIVADANVVERIGSLGKKIGKYVQEHEIELVGHPVVMTSGEMIKTDNFNSVMVIANAIIQAKMRHDDVVLTIGGGSLLDVAGYAAAQVRGGVRIIRMPTTPSAMLDAAFVNNAAINTPMVKDAMQVKSVPDAVITDCNFATMVLDGVWRAGFGEAVRIALAHDAGLMKKLGEMAEPYRKRDVEAMKAVIGAAQAVRVKKGATTIGMWAAKRMQAMSGGYKMPYGYAMVVGTCIDMAYAVEKGMMKSEECDEVMRILKEGGALDGFSYARKVLLAGEFLLAGISAWNLCAEKPGIELPHGIGKVKVQQEIEKDDKEVYRAVIAKLVALTKCVKV